MRFPIILKDRANAEFPALGKPGEGAEKSTLRVRSDQIEKAGSGELVMVDSPGVNRDRSAPNATGATG
jgi:hypothetical protein